MIGQLLARPCKLRSWVGWQPPSPSKNLGWALWVSCGEKARDWTMQYITGWWFGTWFLFFSMYWEFLHPNWRNHIFQRGGSTSNHKPDYIIIKCKDDGVGTLGWSISFSVYTDQHPSLTAKRLPWYQGLDPVPMWMMIKDPSKTGSDSGLSDMVNILPVLFLLLLLL